MQTEFQTPETIELLSSWRLQGDALAVRTGKEDGLWVEVFIFSEPHTGNANPIPNKTLVPKNGNLKPQTRNVENLRRIYKSQLQYACAQINSMASK